jgi:aconitate hydratase
LWSNVTAQREHAFRPLDESYVDNARQGPHAVVAGRNYGQGSSREQAALAPRALGLRLVLAAGIARIHAENLVNYGILPLLFADPTDHDRLRQGTTLRLHGLHNTLRSSRASRSSTRELTVDHDNGHLTARHLLSPRQVEVLLAGGVIPWLRRQRRQR